jgi:hypothetical protein
MPRKKKDDQGQIGLLEARVSNRAPRTRAGRPALLRHLAHGGVHILMHQPANHRVSAPAQR